MTVIYNRKQTGLYDNGCVQSGTNKNFLSYSAYSLDSLSGSHSLGVLSNSYGGTFLGNQFVTVDTSKTYQHAVSARTIENNYLGNPGSGHLGFSCYDESFNFIDLRNCGDVGNTTLSRNLNAGDTHIYLTSVSGWETGADVTSINIAFRNVLFFPATHPKYSEPWKYTRIGFGDFNIHYKSAVLTGSGDWELKLCNASNVDIVMPNIGYPTPSGTPVSRGVAGGTFNYAHSNPNYPNTWTTYITPPFTGESRNSTYPFRYATKYIKFLNLVNFNFSSQNAGNSARYLLDNIILVQCPNNQALPNSFFSRSDVL
jgi:hypothetical protein